MREGGGRAGERGGEGKGGEGREHKVHNPNLQHLPTSLHGIISTQILVRMELAWHPKSDKKNPLYMVDKQVLASASGRA